MMIIIKRTVSLSNFGKNQIYYLCENNQMLILDRDVYRTKIRKGMNEWIAACRPPTWRRQADDPETKYEMKRNEIKMKQMWRCRVNLYTGGHEALLGFILRKEADSLNGSGRLLVGCTDLHRPRYSV